MEAAVIFDGDDTLWVTEPLYDEARQVARAIVEAAGLDGATWEALERARDVANVERFGMSAKRFPTSCVEAFDEMVQDTSAVVPCAIRDAVWDAATRVFEEPAPLVDGATEVVRELARDYRLALLTKGDPDVQVKRIADSRLASFFDVVKVVPHKDADAFRQVRNALGAEVLPCYSIGNSLGSDVLPALTAGIEAVWLDAHVWEYERRLDSVPDEVLIATRLIDVPAILRHARSTAHAS